MPTGRTRALGKASLSYLEACVEIIEAVDGPSLTSRLTILACPAALTPHVEFALSRTLGGPVFLDWSVQGATPALLCSQAQWTGPAGSAERVVAALRGVQGIPFEVTTDPAPGCDAARWAWHPDLGLHHAALDSVGQVVVAEGPLRSLLSQAGDGAAVAQGLSRLLGDAWEEAFEPLRIGGEAAQETRLRLTG